MSDVDARTLHRVRLNELPSPPQLLLPLMRLCADEEAAPIDATNLIGQDSALSARVLSAASAPVFGGQHRATTLDGAIRAIGMDTVRSVALAATVQQFFNTFAGDNREWLPRLWQQALSCGTLGYQIARCTGSGNPDEAYLAGLLHNIGQLGLCHQLRREYTDLLDEANAADRQLIQLECERLGIDHVQLGADLLERWHVSAVLVDAVRHHQEDVTHLVDAHGLVRSTALARILTGSGGEPDSVARHGAAHLFDLGPTAVTCVLHRAAQDRDRLRGALGEEPSSSSPPHGSEDALGQELRHATLLGDVRRHLQNDTPLDAIARCAVLLFGIRHVVCLQLDDQGAFMHVLPPGGSNPRLGELVVPAERERSLMATCLRDNHPVHTLDPAVEKQLAVVDRQIQSQIPGDGLLGLPMRTGDTAVGVLVLGIRHDQISALLDEAPLLLAFATEAGQAMLRAQRQRRYEREAINDGVAAARADRDDVIREAGEPLTVMRNYLAALEAQIGRGHPVYGQLLALNEEAQRLADLLGDNAKVEGENHTGSGVNDQVRRALRVAETSGVLPPNVTLHWDLNPELDVDPAPVPRVLQQILLNLLRALASQLTASVTLTLCTTGSVEAAGQRYVEVVLEHTGSDLPEAVRRQLLAGSLPSTRQAGSAAEGLFTAITLLRDIGGLITHRHMTRKGSRIQILFPARAPGAASEELVGRA